MLDIIQRPHNVNEPVNYQMTSEQLRVYKKLCGSLHKQLGYDWNKLKDVEYDM